MSQLRSPSSNTPIRASAFVLSVFLLGATACAPEPSSIRHVDRRIHAGCAIGSEPQTGKVEYAAGLVALIASLVGLRRRLRKGDEPPPLEDRHRSRLPSLP